MSVLEDLIKERNRTADEIGELLSMRDSINSDIAEKRDRLQELNDEIDYTRTEEENEEANKRQKLSELLKSNDYSLLAREYRRLDKAICEGRKRGWSKPVISLHQQRRDVGDRMLEMVDL